MNPNVPDYFIPMLSYEHTPYQFMDIIGYCLYKGLSLNFSANKNTGEYFGYFTNHDNHFINSDCFKFSDLNEYLFKDQNIFNQYIKQNKVVVKLRYHHRRYILELKKEVYDVFNHKYTWVTILKSSSPKIKTTFMKMNHLLMAQIKMKNNEKIIDMKSFRQA